MNVLVIPEDFRKDQYILAPIVRAMMEAMNRRARVRVCQDPLLGGISEALKLERQREIVRRYRGMIDLYLLCVDRDGAEGRRKQLDRLEADMAAEADGHCVFLSENAWQELEVWILAGHDLPTAWRWEDVRNERDPKERYFAPFARLRKAEDGPGEGRKALAEEAARRLDRVRRLSPEVGAFMGRIEAALARL